MKSQMYTKQSGCTHVLNELPLSFLVSLRKKDLWKNYAYCSHVFFIHQNQVINKKHSSLD